MRDLIFMLAPVALIIYAIVAAFLAHQIVVFPDQFGALLGWAGHYVH